ncbi:Uncharacterised protein [Enterobacter hormaechei]|nr:Uncharacterised protein [Enterobacter hormaechei]
MTVKNQELIAAGFTSKDIERINRHHATGGLHLFLVLPV